MCDAKVVVTELGSSVQCMTTDWTAGVRSLAETKDFSSRLGALRPTHPPIHWIPGDLSWG
jgi:hypothetical protein